MEKTVGNTTVFPNMSEVANRRAVPYVMSEDGSIESISIYHQGGTGSAILAVYGDASGQPGTRLGVTNSTLINGIAGWQTISLQSPVAVSAGQTIWLAWVFENDPGMRWTAGTRAARCRPRPGRAGCRPASEHRPRTTPATASTRTTAPQSADNTIGNTTVFPNVSEVANRRAIPCVMSEDGFLKSISVYHQGGTGNAILAVYGDASGQPGTRLGVTNSTPVNSTEGWQTISLQSPVAVSAGQTIWLAWVFENDPGMRWIAGTPGRAMSPATWSGGMPTSFGSSSVTTGFYSIYATYSPEGEIPAEVIVDNRRRGGIIDGHVECIRRTQSVVDEFHGLMDSRLHVHSSPRIWCRGLRITCMHGGRSRSADIPQYRTRSAAAARCWARSASIRPSTAAGGICWASLHFTDARERDRPVGSQLCLRAPMPTRSDSFLSLEDREEDGQARMRQNRAVVGLSRGLLTSGDLADDGGQRGLYHPQVQDGPGVPGQFGHCDVQLHQGGELPPGGPGHRSPGPGA